MVKHQLGFIGREEVLKAIEFINENGVPKENKWNEYYILYDNNKYPFKYTVEVASTFTKNKIRTIDFTSNKSSRNYIGALGFHISYTDQKHLNHIPKYWVAASYYGIKPDIINMVGEFVQDNYWATDHYLDKGEGLKIVNKLKEVSINDRICIRYLDKKGGNVQIAEVGTVNDVSEVESGKLGVIWDYNPPKYHGKKPSGKGAGDWWKTFIQITRPADIETIFQTHYHEKRIARLAWNDNGWVMPSGPNGKSQHEDSHEGNFGYGHEEWLFDTSKLVDGYHYAFIEPIRKQQAAYQGNTYDVWLYTIDGISKNRYWIGEILGVEVITEKEAKRVKEIYRKKEWIDEMRSQIEVSGGNDKGFSEWEGVDLFNVRFKTDAIKLNEDPYIEIPSDNPINELSRYVFGLFKQEYNVVEPDEIDDSFLFDPDDSDEETDSTNEVKTKKSFRKPKAIEIKYLHDAISKSLFKYLRNECGYKVRREHNAGYGANRIDVVAKNGKNLLFYEIKTYNSLKTSIREAVGQLIEYSYWPNKNKADELIIITQPHKNISKAVDYIKHLRNTLKLPLYFQMYDHEKEELSEKY